MIFFAFLCGVAAGAALACDWSHWLQEDPAERWVYSDRLIPWIAEFPDGISVRQLAFRVGMPANLAVQAVQGLVESGYAHVGRIGAPVLPSSAVSLTLSGMNMSKDMKPVSWFEMMSDTGEPLDFDGLGGS